MSALTHRMERFALGIGLVLTMIVGYVAMVDVTPAAAASGSSWNMINAYPADNGAYGAIVTNPATGDIITSGDNLVEVTAGSDGTRYGVAMTAGNTYIVAQDVGDEFGLALDPAGDLIVGNENYVEEISIATGDVTTVAGNGTYTAGASGTPAIAGGIDAYGGVAVDGATGDIVVSDGITSALRVIAESTAPYMGADGGSALTVGDIYTLADTSEAISVVIDASNGNVLYDADNAVYLDAANTGTYYDVSATAYTPVVIAGQAGVFNDTGDVTSSTQTAAPATGATFGDDEGLMLDASGNVFVADAGADAIRVVAAGTGAASIYGVSPSGGVTDGDLYTIAGTGQIGVITQYAPATSSELDFPAGEALLGGNLLINDGTGVLEEIGAPTAPLTPPPNLTTVASAGVLASWQIVPITEQGFQATTSYTMTWYQCTAIGSCSGTPAGSATVSASATSTTISDLDADQLYGFSVAANNASGAGPASGLSYASSGIYAPGPVTGLSATTSSGQMQATWSAPATDGGSAITGYTATLSPCSSGCTEDLGAGATIATFSGLTNGTTYAIAVAALSSAGTGPSTPVSATPTGLAGAPTIDAATPGNAAVTLNWAAPGSNGGSAITDYKVVVNGGVTIDTSSTATTFTVSSLTNGDIYGFQVEAVNSNGTGSLSAVIHATPVTAPSAAPSGIGQSAADQSATISWTAVPAGSDGGSAVTGYLVEALQGSTTVASTTVNAATGTATITGLQNGTSYTLEVAAENSVGTGAFATSAAVTPSAVPGAPSNVVATANANGSVTLTWAAPADNGSAITGYKVLTTPATTGSPYSTGTSATSFTVAAGAGDLVLGTTYTFEVAAVNVNGTGPASIASDALVPATAPSAAPSGIGQSAADQSATISWTAVPAGSDGGSAVTGYLVEALQGSTTVASTTVNAATGTATITGLQNGTSYTLEVAAENSVGTGAFATSAAVTPSAVPGAPSNVVATANANGSVTLTWAAPADNGSAITGYKVLTTPATTGSPYSTGTSATSFTVAAGAGDLVLGTTYTFEVAAVNVNGTGPASIASDALVPATAPSAAPSGIGQSAADQSATISWTAVPAGSDGGSAVTGYLVEALQGSTTVASTTVNAATGTATITGLQNGTSYTLEVAAENSVGTGAFATSAAVTPLAVPGAPSSVVATSALDDSGSVVLTWAAPADNGSAVTDYEVTPTVVGGSALPVIDTGSSATSYTVSGGTLTPGTTYTFEVAAANVAGDGPSSALSNEAASLTVPGAPGLNGSSDASSSSDGTVTLVWGTPADNGAIITSYTVAPAPACAGCTGLVVNGSPAATAATVGGLTLGISYTFTVTATNELGASAPSIVSNAVTPAMPPAAPAGVSAVAALTGTDKPQINVTWTAADANGSSLSGNTLTATPVAGGTAVTAAVAGGETTGSITTGLDPGTSYNVTVTATNGVGAGTVSSPPAVVTSDGVPAAPNSVVATQLVPGSASLTWAAPDDNGSVVTRYAVTPDPACPTCAGLLVSGNPAANATTVTGLSVGTAYTFTVTATNLVGTGPVSTPSNRIAAAGVPNAPFKVVATAGDALAVVTWSSPVPNNNPVTGYTVRATAVDCAGACPATVVVSLAGNPPNTTIVVSGLVNGVTYHVTVTASNAAGYGPMSVAAVVVPSREQGYWIATAQGHVYGYGSAPSLGAAAAFKLKAPIVGITATSTGRGYWQVGSNGAVFNFGDAGFFGSTASIHLNEPAVGLAATGDNRGYWIVASDGGIFGFGDAHFHGSLPQLGVHVNNIVGIVATADGGGYWMVGSDGGIFAFGDARYLGSLPGEGVHVGNIVDFVPTKDNRGYWMVGSNGGVFAFGDAKFVGSLGGSLLASPIGSMTGTPSGRGYWLVSRNGNVFNEGDADNEGSPAGLIPGQTVVGIASSS